MLFENRQWGPRLCYMIDISAFDVSSIIIHMKPSRVCFGHWAKTFCLALDLINFGVIKARLAHFDEVVLLTINLLIKVHLGHVLGPGVRRREVIQVLEAMLMSFVSRENRPFLLLGEVDETFRSRLNHRLMISTHGAEVKRVNSCGECTLVVTILSAELLRASIYWAEALLLACLTLHFLLPCKEFIVVPHAIEYLWAALSCRASFFGSMLLFSLLNWQLCLADCYCECSFSYLNLFLLKIARSCI